jgi:hypothetical protein
VPNRAGLQLIRLAKAEPVPGRPTGRWDSTEAMEQFLLARARTQELLEESSYLRGRIVPNPVQIGMDIPELSQRRFTLHDTSCR